MFLLTENYDFGSNEQLQNINYMNIQKQYLPCTAVNISVLERIRIISSNAGNLSTSIFLTVTAAIVPRLRVNDDRNLNRQYIKELHYKNNYEQ